MVLPSQLLNKHSGVSRLLSLTETTGYEIVQNNGQRIYGPPPDWSGPPPRRGCEVFVGKLPRDIFEDELVPFMERIGKVYETRLMMDFGGTNRGYAFVMYTKKEDAMRAIKDLNNEEIRKGRRVVVVKSVDNCRLFFGGLPKCKKKEEIKEAISNLVEGVEDVILYSSTIDKTKSRGFALVEFESHRFAAMARRKLNPEKYRLWGNEIVIDWAEPENEVDETIMSKVTVLYVRNLRATTSELRIKKIFEKAGNAIIHKVKKKKDFAFVHFYIREPAERALQVMNGVELDGAVIEVMWAKPMDKSLYRMHKPLSRCTNNDFRKCHSGGFTSSSQHNRLVSWNSGSAFGTNNQIPELPKRPVRGAAGYCGGRVPIQPNSMHMMMPVIPEVTVLYVRNLMATTSELRIKKIFEKAGNAIIHKVKKIKDFAFVHFYIREPAERALQVMNGVELDGAVIEVMWAKPMDKSLYRMHKPLSRCTNNDFRKCHSGGFTSSSQHNRLVSWNSGSAFGTNNQIPELPKRPVRGAAGYCGGRVPIQPNSMHMMMPVIPEVAVPPYSISADSQEDASSYVIASPSRDGYEAAAYYDGDYCISEPSS